MASSSFVYTSGLGGFLTSALRLVVDFSMHVAFGRLAAPPPIGPLTVMAWEVSGPLATTLGVVESSTTLLTLVEVSATDMDCEALARRRRFRFLPLAVGETSGSPTE